MMRTWAFVVVGTLFLLVVLAAARALDGDDTASPPRRRHVVGRHEALQGVAVVGDEGTVEDGSDFLDADADADADDAALSATDDDDASPASPGDAETEAVTVVASADGLLHGFDAQHNKKWTSSSGGPLATYHAAGNLDFSVVPGPLDGSLFVHSTEGMRKTSVTARMLVEKGAFATQVRGRGHCHHRRTPHFVSHTP